MSISFSQVATGHFTCMLFLLCVRRYPSRSHISFKKCFKHILIMSNQGGRRGWGTKHVGGTSYTCLHGHFPDLLLASCWNCWINATQILPEQPTILTALQTMQLKRLIYAQCQSHRVQFWSTSSTERCWGAQTRHAYLQQQQSLGLKTHLDYLSSPDCKEASSFECLFKHSFRKEKVTKQLLPCWITKHQSATFERTMDDNPFYSHKGSTASTSGWPITCLSEALTGWKQSNAAESCAPHGEFSEPTTRLPLFPSTTCIRTVQ